MLSMVEIVSNQGTLLTLPLDGISNGLLVEDIQGLGPVKATLVSSSFARLDGQQYQTSRRDTRNIKFTIGLEPDYITETVSSLRQRLYGFFMTKTQVKMTFHTSEGQQYNISGRVETCEPSLFTQEPAVDISVICFNPDFYDPTPIQITGLSVADSTEIIGVYEGTVETGIKFTLNVDRDVSAFTIYHRPPDDSLYTLDFATPLMAGDTLFINTMAGEKEATLTRNNNDSPILYGISPQSKWLELMPGDNSLRVYAEGTGIPFTIEYINKYGGL